MAKHTWDTPPSAAKAEEMARYFLLPFGRGIRPEKCRAFAAYALERVKQGDRRVFINTIHLARAKQLYPDIELKDYLFFTDTEDEEAVVLRRIVSLKPLLDSVRRSYWRFMDGVNGGRYRQLWKDHLPFWFGDLAERLGMRRTTPPLLLIDALLDRGEDEGTVRRYRAYLKELDQTFEPLPR